MVNNEHYARLKEGVPAWNEWRLKNLNIVMLWAKSGNYSSDRHQRTSVYFSGHPEN
ncbi:hypothetical protein H6G04_35085 [Calothrix membranacea FACHB-236]|nr:hypothetical protein [Calothrix membranacea FACHB-236]